jgi:hypothetical protein
MDMRLWWLRCCASQDQFCYLWDTGTKNWANYNTIYQPTAALMQAYGMGWALDTHLLARPMALRFPLTGFPNFVFLPIF